MRTGSYLCIAVLLGALVLRPGAAGAEEELKPLQNPDGVKALVRLLEEKKVLTEDDANDFLYFWEEKRVQAKENNAETERKILQASSWASRIRFGGDIRLRYEGKFYDKSNATFISANNPSTVEDFQDDQHRTRYRLRLGVNAQINDISEVGVRLATGNTSEPVSTNTTMGDYFNKDNILVDQAYLKIRPVQYATVWAGRMPNPFFTTDIIWDSDVNPEGFATQIAYSVSRQVKLFGTGAAFSVREVKETQDDQWLFAGQVGTEYKPLDYLKGKVAVAYYSYTSIVGRRNPSGSDTSSGPNDWTSPLYQQGGNSVFNINDGVSGASTKFAPASRFNILDLLFELDARITDPYHVILGGQFVRNLGFDLAEVRDRVGPSTYTLGTRNSAYMGSIKTGYPQINKALDWQTYLVYKYIEGDAVLDAFNDSDFHGGGTNARGWILGALLGVYDNLWLETKWMTADEIDGPPLAIDTLQVDLNARF